jgi:hypothetical protein
MTETKKPALAVGQKWRMKNGGIVAIHSRSVNEDPAEGHLFLVDLHDYKYTHEGCVMKIGLLETDKILEQLELVELIDQPVEEKKQSAPEVRAEFPATEPPKFPEHWDTRACMDAITTRNRKFMNPTDMARQVSGLAFRDGVEAGIAYERERCIGVCQAMRPPCGRAWASKQADCFDALSIAAENIRSGVDPWAGRPEWVKQKALDALEEAIEHLRGGEPMRPEDLKETYEQIKAGLDLTF